jgi:hypothetical protein
MTAVWKLQLQIIRVPFAVGMLTAGLLQSSAAARQLLGFREKIGRIYLAKRLR